MPLPQENRMQMAIHVYRCEKIHSQSKAIKVFSVPMSTFQNWLKGMNPQSETRANGHKLTVLEEESLVKQLLDTDKQGFLIQPEYVRRMA